MAFDLKQQEELAAAEESGIDVEIKDAAGQPITNLDGTTPATIRIVGSLSATYRDQSKRLRGKAMNKTAAQIKRERSETDAEAGARSIREQTEAIASLVLGWSDGFTDGGAPFPFSKANAIALLVACPFIEMQLTIAADDHSRFFSPPSTN